MTRLSWSDPNDRIVSSGLERGVFYGRDGVGVPWHGLISVSESENSDTISFYLDGEKKYRSGLNPDFSGTITAYTYPEELDSYSSFTNRVSRFFGLSYRVSLQNLIGETGYQIHIIYNILAKDADVTHQSLSDDVDIQNFEWEFTSVPEKIPGSNPAAHIIFDSRYATEKTIGIVEDILYGTIDTDPRLPHPEELLTLAEQGATLIIIDHGDGTWSATGPDEIVYMVSDDLFAISWDSVVYIDTQTYKVSSL